MTTPTTLVARLLTAEGIPVAQHPSVYEISRIYQQCGVDLGQCELFHGTLPSGWALVVPPGTPTDERLGRQVRIALTGWAMDPGARYRLRVDHALPLSDHADYDELFEAVRRVRPRKIYCTHGPESFVDRLREAGYDAHPLGRATQLRLFD